MGTANIGSAVGVEGKLTIGRPKELTADGVVGSRSRLGNGMENGGGPAMEGIPVEDKVVEERDVPGRVADGRTRLVRLVGGRMGGSKLGGA